MGDLAEEAVRLADTFDDDARAPTPRSVEEIAREVQRDIYCNTCNNSGFEPNGRQCRDCDHAIGIIAAALQHERDGGGR